MFAIDIEYLSGVCYAATAHDDGVAEWPPSPDRLFSALVDSMSSMDDGPAKAGALRWLESLEPPEVMCPPHGARDVHAFWVPVQDRKGGDGRHYDGRGPGLPPVARKPRWFPAVALPDDERTVTMAWNADPPAEVIDGLKYLAAGVSRLGHSSSLVRVEVKTGAEARGRIRYVPGRGGGMPIKCPFPGRLDDLLEGYREAKETGAVWHPSLSVSCPRYSILDDSAAAQVSPIWGEWTVLGIRGTVPTPESFPAVAKAIHSAIVSELGRAVPEALSGLAPDESPSRRPHMAIVPMLNVGWPHSSGGLLGVSLVMPVGTNGGSHEMTALGTAVGALTSPDNQIVLPGGAAVSFGPADGRTSLQTDRYTRASRVWTTVTPIAVDRHCHPGKDPGPGIADSVERMGLPRPAQVEVSRGGMAYGASHAGRWVRHAGRGGLWHARIEFSEAVPGPVMVGAMRYRGLGLCVPGGDGHG